MIHIFLPAYNEEVALERLIKKFDDELTPPGKKYQITVLDDGSSDGTAEVARRLGQKYPVNLLRHAVNQGLGQTMVDGLTHIASTAAGEDVVVTMDCDDTHDPKYMHAALAKINEGFDMVILSRYQKGGGEEGLSAARSVLSRGAGLFLKFFFPMRGIWEYSCGYRVFRVSSLKKAIETFGKDFVRFTKMGFVVTPEILIKFRMLGFKIAEAPFVLNYGRKPGKSSNKPLKTIRGYFALVLAYGGRKYKKQAAKV